MYGPRNQYVFCNRWFVCLASDLDKRSSMLDVGSDSNSNSNSHSNSKTKSKTKTKTKSNGNGNGNGASNGNSKRMWHLKHMLSTQGLKKDGRVVVRCPNDSTH